MGNTKNTYGKPVFDDNYSFPQDSQDGADFTDEFANVRRLSSSDRQALVAGKQRPGMLVSETDKAALYRTDGASNWTPLVTEGGRIFAIASGSVATAASGVTAITFPTGKFSQPPLVFLSSSHANPTVPYLSGAPSTTGCNVVLYTLTPAQVAGTIRWLAIQMTSAAAAG
ncbi:hypothetical protein [Microbacterium maritypicum]